MDRNKLLAKLHILLKQTGAEEHKEELYAGYDVTSSRNMTDDQLVDLIVRLGAISGNDPVRIRPTPEVRAMRSEVLFVLTANPDAQQSRRRGLGIPNDWQVLNPFIYTHGGKRLSDMDYGELAEFKKKLYAMRATGWRYWRSPQPTPLLQVPTSKEVHPNLDVTPRTRGQSKDRSLPKIIIVVPPDDGPIN